MTKDPNKKLIVISVNLLKMINFFVRFT